MADILNPVTGQNFFLSRRDPRAKLVILFTIPVFTFYFSILPLLLILPLLTAAVLRTEIKTLSLLKASAGFIFIILLPPGTELFKIISGYGDSDLSAALRFSLILLDIYMTGILIIRSTGIREIQNGAAWFLSFIPFIPARKTSLLIGLTFTMLPGILFEWRGIRAAQRTRGADSIRNPLKRLTAPLFPLLLNAILKSETTAAALETRGWKEHDPRSARQIRELQRLEWKTADTVLLISTVSCLTFLTIV